MADTVETQPVAPADERKPDDWCLFVPEQGSVEWHASQAQERRRRDGMNYDPYGDDRRKYR